MILVALTARASYAKVKTILEALLARGADVTLLACASALLERYGAVVNVVRADFPSLPIEECWSVFEGENLLTSARETGALLMESASVIHRLRPRGVLVIADRHEVLAIAQAASYQHVKVWHAQGGEISGSIDDKVRNAITALADLHFPATAAACRRIGATDWYGCPSIDLALRAAKEPRVTVKEIGGAGADLELGTRHPLPLVVWLQHPVTDEAADAAEQMRTTARALALGCYDVLAFWPGQDAGAGAMSKVLRVQQGELHTVRNMPPQRFLKLLTQAACLVGNSSAGIRECSALGVPVVNIGNRQRGRERAANVVDVPHDVDAIFAAIEAQIAHGSYPASDLYGDGRSGKRIAHALLSVDTRARRFEGHPKQEFPASA